MSRSQSAVPPRHPTTLSRASWPRTFAFVSAAALLPALTLACSDSTGSQFLAVELTAQRTAGPNISSDGQGGARVECFVSLRAVARGTGAGEWSHATWYWYAGPDRATPIDSSHVSAAEVLSSWGQADIAAGDTLITHWSFRAGIPYHLEIVQHYRPSGASKARTARASFDCGVTTAAADPPVISAMSVIPAAGEVEAGSAVRLSYTVRSEVGIWRTIVDLYGPCQLQQDFTDENLRKEVSRTVTFELPASCFLGMPVKFRVIAVDAAMVHSERFASPDLVIMDRTPPSLLPMFFPPDGGSARLNLSGVYFAGDSIQIISNAGDNHELAALVWEILPWGHKDSIIVNAPGAPRTTFISLPDNLTGEIRLRFHARDHQGLLSNVVTANGTAMVHPTIVRPTRSAVVPGEIRDFVIDEAGGVIHLLQTNQRRLTTLSLSTLAVLSSVEIPSAGRFDLTPSGDSLVLAIWGTGNVGVVDLTKPGYPVSIIPLQGLDTTIRQWPASVAVASNGKAFISTDGTSLPAFEIIEMDLSTGVQRKRQDAGYGAKDMRRSLDHRVVAGVGSPTRLYDASTDSFGPPGLSVPCCYSSSLDAAGRRLAVGLDVYDESLQLLRRLQSIFWGAPPTVLSADGEYLYVNHAQRGVLRLRVSDGTLLDRTRNAVGIEPEALKVSASGAILVSVDPHFAGPSRISTIDLR